MDIEKALEIKKSLLTLMDVLNMEFNDLVAQICFYDDEKLKVLKEASDLWNKFDDADIVERGKMLGINVTVYPEVKNGKRKKNFYYPIKRAKK
jgi:hypothetical protein